MLLKLFLVTVLLFEATSAYHGKTKDVERKVSFSIEKVWQSYRKPDECYKNAEWKAGVQEFYTGTRTASWKFRGPSYDLADNVMLSFEEYLTKLIYLTNTNSTVLTDSSTSILEAMSICNKLSRSALIIITEFHKVLAIVVKDFKEVVSKLSKFIGNLACSFNDALTSLFLAFSEFMKCFLECTTLKCKEKLDYTPVVREYQVLLNTVALIAETLINKCDAATHDAYQAVTILTIVYDFFAISVQGINTCVQDIIFKENGAIASNTRCLSESMHYVLLEITPAINGISFPFTKTMEKLLTILVHIAISFNTSAKDVLGVFEGVVLTVGEISHNLGKDEHAADRTNILKGITPK